tara:strand:+ start:30 stop:203 length:174 start_codon:yes stop_codon:yes gene_type:complete
MAFKMTGPPYKSALKHAKGHKKGGWHTGPKNDPDDTSILQEKHKHKGDEGTTLKENK